MKTTSRYREQKDPSRYFVDCLGFSRTKRGIAFEWSMG